MRIGVIGDIHGDIATLAEVLSVLSGYKVDMLLAVGDIGPDTLPPGLNSRDMAEYFPRGYSIAKQTLKDMWGSSILCIEKLLTSLQVPVYLVPGNHDLRAYPINNSELVHNCDHRLVQAKGIGILGWGGASRTVLGWPYEWADSEAEKSWKDADLPVPAGPWILLSHAPPHPRRGGLLKGLMDNPATCFMRNLVERTCPSLCVCGHIHNVYGARLHGQTLVVNAGSINKQVYTTNSLIHSPGDVIGCQVSVLESSDDFDEIENVSILLPVRDPLSPVITKAKYRLSRG